MGPWDIMSEHFVQRQQPPPGISSFTKIRLNWISPGQVVTALPGETSMAFLSPLSKGGKTLAVKISLPDGNYYLIENRQPVGYDGILPDAGIIVLKVFPKAQEGYGTVELMNADPSAPHFSRAAYSLERGRGAFFVDRKSGFAVVPLWKEGDATGVIVTAPQEAEEALKAARAIDELQKTFSQPPAQGQASSLADAKAAFGRGDFKAGRRIALEALQRSTPPGP
jgi:hypothetical protein